MNGALLPAFPADRQQLEQAGPMDEVPGVMLSRKIKVRRKTGRIHSMAPQKVENTLVREFPFRTGGELLGEILNGHDTARARKASRARFIGAGSGSFEPFT